MNACAGCPSVQNCCQTVQKSLTVALVGNPNCGKTTLFNALTGARQRVGNWPGVTVERKSGQFIEAGTQVTVVDLPGIYTLALASEIDAIDERIACEYIAQGEAQTIVNIVDASHLERHLYLTMQLRAMGVPVIVALNMMDVARARGVYIDVEKLSAILGCPVVALEANRGNGIASLKQMMANDVEVGAPLAIAYPVAQMEDEDSDILMADARYRFIEAMLQQCASHTPLTKTTWTSRIDHLVLNRVLGIPIFLSVMYCLFLFSINIGGAFQDFFDISSQTLCVDGLAYALNQLGTPTWLTVLLANGVGKGINTTITFIPVIGAMFFFLALLEDSGYMARAAFVVDRFMRMLGLPGKAFVPMIVGFGCNVPAVMAARTLENKQDRIVTIMMSPFMSCGARLAIFAVFTAAFFPRGGQNIIFALYLIGIVMAVITGFILRKTLLKGEASPLVMELPLYHLPHAKTVCLHAWQRLKSFVFRAGKLIVPICVLIGFLNSLNMDGAMNAGEGDANSLLSTLGQWVTPIFAPMGIHTDNWPATVGLVTGVLAKEVVVGTLNTLYTQVGQLVATSSASNFDFWAGLSSALRSIPDNFAQLGDAFTNPVLAKAPIDEVGQGVYGLMYRQFDGQVGAFAYLLFVLLYFPCISTTAAMLRELHRGWAIFSVLWMTGIAYGTATAFYQAATWGLHPWASTIWLFAIASVFLGVIISIRWYGERPSPILNVT